jgi:hypothetical protein
MVTLYECFSERSYGGADRDAILRLARWSRAEIDGRVPLALEDDDWGRELAAALDALPAEARHATQRLLEWFDEDVETKPARSWLAELAARSGDFDRAALVRWLSETLPRFARTSLAHTAGTPGVGAFPGETSGRILLGLVHLAGLFDAPELVPALGAVAAAAYTVVPQERVRAQGVGNVCVILLARSAQGRERLAELRRTIRHKVIAKTIDTALGG